MKNRAVLKIVNEGGKGKFFVCIYFAESYIGWKGIHINSPVVYVNVVGCMVVLFRLFKKTDVLIQYYNILFLLGVDRL